MAETQPRLAVAYHFFNDHDTLPQQIEEIRKVYDGPLAMAQDYMVFNVTKDDIKVRMAAINEDIWPTPPTRAKVAVDKGSETLSKFILSGDYFMEDFLTKVWKDTAEEFNSDVQLPPGGLRGMADAN